MKIEVEKYHIRRLALLFIILLIITISTILIINKIPKSKKIYSDKKMSNVNALLCQKDGNIEFEENKYFKKLTINFNEKIDKPKWSQVKDMLSVNIDKISTSKLSLKSEKNTTLKDVYITDSKDKKSFILKIKKAFNIEDDDIYIDKNTGKKLIILVSKIKNPYKYKVVLDPGHGGRDPGNMIGKVPEKEENLIICNYMYNKLVFNGCKVIMTRTTDKELDNLIKNDLKDRADVANNCKADIFVSIHINAANTRYKNYKEYHGISTHYYTKNNEKQKDERMKLAQSIEDNAVKSDGWAPCKILETDDSVLRNTVMPSALVECGYITNNDDNKRLSDTDTVIKLSDNISDGIIKYLNK